jgi:hypothetical protein
MWPNIERGLAMTIKHFTNICSAAAGSVLVCALGILSPANAIGGEWSFERGAEVEDARILRVFEIAPVPLNLRGTDPALVGLGSYLVNAVASCNDCHAADPSVEFAPGGNPYFKGSPPKVVNQSVYLGGGRNFGSLIPGTPQIVSRNLTPDKTGLPIGGRTGGSLYCGPADWCTAQRLYVVREDA